MAPYLPTVSIGRYRMFRSAMDHGRIPLVTFVDTKLGRQAEARRSLPRVIRFLERTFGRYPFQSSGMVIDRIDVGYALETQSRPVMPFRAPSYLITHEIAHQWVGNSVTPRDWKDIWLNEGFATYTEWLWDAERFDKPATPQQFDFLYEIYGPKSSFWETPPANPGSVNKLFALPVYNRGAMALQALRMRIGSHDFRTVLHRWAQQNAGRTVTTGDFKSSPNGSPAGSSTGCSARGSTSPRSRRATERTGLRTRPTAYGVPPRGDRRSAPHHPLGSLTDQQVRTVANRA